jgi:hypothetical protein
MIYPNEATTINFFYSLSVAIIRFYPSLILEDKPGYLGGAILGWLLRSALASLEILE